MKGWECTACGMKEVGVVWVERRYWKIERLWDRGTGSFEVDINVSKKLEPWILSSQVKFVRAVLCQLQSINLNLLNTG